MHGPRAQQKMPQLRAAAQDGCGGGEGSDEGTRSGRGGGKGRGRDPKQFVHLWAVLQVIRGGVVEHRVALAAVGGVVRHAAPPASLVRAATPAQRRRALVAGSLTRILRALHPGRVRLHAQHVFGVERSASGARGMRTRSVGRAIVRAPGRRTRYSAMGRFPGSEIPAPPSRARGEIFRRRVRCRTREEHTGKTDLKDWRESMSLSDRFGRLPSSSKEAKRAPVHSDLFAHTTGIQTRPNVT